MSFCSHFIFHFQRFVPGLWNYKTRVRLKNRKTQSAIFKDLFPEQINESRRPSNKFAIKSENWNTKKHFLCRKLIYKNQKAISKSEASVKLMTHASAYIIYLTNMAQLIAFSCS